MAEYTVESIWDALLIRLKTMTQTTQFHEAIDLLELAPAPPAELRKALVSALVRKGLKLGFLLGSRRAARHSSGVHFDLWDSRMRRLIAKLKGDAPVPA